ncbi:MAG: hypothetical protein LBC97_11155 [Bifidobacteriaceae bacterium]|nr:hypothetical protein [Bifidobacteriaceae bacterium]
MQNWGSTDGSGAAGMREWQVFAYEAPAHQHLDFCVIVSTRGAAGNVFLPVQGGNNDEVPADVAIRTVFGTKTHAAVTSSKKTPQLFTTRLKVLAAEKSAIAGNPHAGRSFSQTFGHPTLTCGG